MTGISFVRRSVRAPRSFFALVVAAVVLLPISSAFSVLPVAYAAVATSLPFSARLTTSAGSNVADGSYSVSFKLYSVATGGTPVWSETQTATVSRGEFAVYLGSITSFASAGVSFANTPYYLAFQVAGDPEMAPRYEIGSVPSALNAATADRATTADGITGINAADLFVKTANETVSGNTTFTGTISVTNAATFAGASTFTGGVSIQPAASTGTALLVNTASGFSGNLLDLQVNGTSRFVASSTGAVTAASTLTVTSGGLVVQNGGLAVSGDSTFNNNVAVVGALTAASLATSGNITSSGTVNGATIAGGSLSNTSVNGLTVSGGTITGGTYQASTIGVPYGGTGATSFTSNGVLYGNAAGSLQVTLAGTTGQALLADATGTPKFTSFSGDVTLAGTGVVTISADAITSAKIADGAVLNSKLANSSVSVTAGTGLSGGGSASLGGSAITLSNTGVLSVAGTTNQVAVSGATGSVTLSLPQDIASTSSPTFAALSLASALSVGNGGTGATTAGDARTNLGAAASGANSDITSLTGLTTALSVAQGGTGQSSYVTGDILYGNSGGGLSKLPLGSAGLCLVSQGGLPTWFSCSAAAGASPLQVSYDSGNEIITTDARDVAITLANTTTDSDFIVNIATGSTGKFAVQSNGTDVLTVTSGGVTIGEPLTTNGGIDNQSAGISNAGAISGATSGDFSNNLSVGGSLAVTGALTGASFNTALISGGTFSGGTISGGTVSGGTLTSTAVNGLSVAAGVVTGGTFNDGVFGGTAAWQGSPVAVLYGGTGATTAGGARTNLGAAASGANSDITSLSGLTTSLSVGQGGTGATTFTPNGLVYGNGTSALQVTAAGTPGQVLLANASGVPTFVSLSGDASVNDLGALTLANSGVSAATYGSATQVPVFAVDAKGRVTSVTNTTISGVAPGGSAGGDLSGTYPNPTVARINGVSLGSTAATTGNLLIGSGSAWVSQGVSGDITLGSTGIATIANGAVTTAKILDENVTTAKIADGNVTNTKLANSSVTVTAGTGLSGGGAVALGSSVTLSNSGVLSVTGTADQVITSASTGDITLSLPQSIATSSTPTFAGLTTTGNASVGGNLAVTGTTTATGLITANGGLTVVGTLTLPSTSVADSALSSNVALLDRSGQTFTGSNLFKPGINSTTALQVQPSGSTTPVFNVDTTNSRVGIGNSSPLYSLDVTGQIRATSTSSSIFGDGSSGAIRVGDGTISKNTGSSFYLNSGFNPNGLVGIGTGSAVTAGAKLQISGGHNLAAQGTSGVVIRVDAATFTDTSSTGTVTNSVASSLGVSTLAATSSTTYTNASTLYIAGAPAAGTNVSITNAYALNVAAGNTNLGGNLSLGGTLAVTGSAAFSSNLAITGTTTLTGALTANGGASVTGGINNNAGGITNAGAISGATTITASGNGSFGGTLGVTGATSLSSTLAVSGVTTLTGVLNANGGIATASGNLTVQAASGILALNTTGTQNALRVYDSSNTKYAEITHNGTNAVISASEGEVQIGSAGGGDVQIGATGASANLIFAENSYISGGGSKTITLGQSGDTFNLNTLGATYNIGNLSSAGVVLATSATGTTALTVNAASGQSANLLDLQVAGSSRFAVAASGAITTAAALTTSGALSVITTTTPQVTFGYDASNRYTTAISSAGAVTFDASGSSAGFTFSDPVTTSSTLAVTGVAALSSNLTVGGTSTFTGLATLNGGVTVAGATSITGATTINTTGTANTAIGNAAGTFALTSTGLNVSTAGAVSGVTTLSASSNGSFGGNLAVTGTAAIAGNTTIGGTLGVTGQLTTGAGSLGIPAINIGGYQGIYSDPSNRLNVVIPGSSFPSVSLGSMGAPIGTLDILGPGVSGGALIRTASGIDISVGLTGASSKFIVGNTADGKRVAEFVNTGGSSRVNYLSFTGGTTGNGVNVAASGTDTNIDLNLIPQGSGKVVTTATLQGAIINATSGFTINGANLNTAGTLSNVAYLNQANTFSLGNTFGSTLAVTGTTTLTGALTANGGASITGGINNNAGGITNAGAISGATTVTASGNGSFGGTLSAAGATSLGSTLAVTGVTTLTGVLNANGGITNASGNLNIQATSGITALNTAATQNTLRVYSSGSNFASLTNDGTNTILSSNTGEVQIGGSGSGDLLLGSASSPTNLIFAESAYISGGGSKTITVGVSGDTFNLNTGGVTYNIGTLSSTAATIATTTTGSTALTVNAATGQSANLLDLQVAGSSRFSVAASGAITTAAGFTTSGAVSILTATSPQLTVGFDASNRYATAVSSTGGVTFDATGAGAAFTFSDALTASSTFTATGASTLGATAVTGATTINTTGTANTAIGNATGTFALTSAGLNVTTAGALSGITTLNASSNVSFGGNLAVTGTTTATGLISANGGVALPNGSVGAPSLSIGGSTIGLYGDGTNLFGAIGGARAFQVLGNGTLNGNVVELVPGGSGSVVTIGSSGGGLRVNAASTTAVDITTRGGTVAARFNVNDANSANYLSFTGAAAASGPILAAIGSDTNIDLNLTPKGTGRVVTAATLQASTVNATTGFTINGTNINTAGTLSNVAYLNQVNTFSAGNTFGSTLAVTGATTLTGLLTANGGATVVGTTAINATGTANTTIGNATGTLGITSSGINISTAGAVTGVTTLTTSGAINGQTISSAANFTGTAAIAGNTTVGGTLGVTGVTTLTGALNANGGIANASGNLTLQATSGVVALNTAATQNELRVYDASGTMYASITHDGTNTVIDSSSGEVQIGGSTGDLILGASGAATNLIFQENSYISGGGSKTISLGQAGDAINLNTASTYNIGTLTAAGAVIATTATGSTALTVNAPTGQSANLLDLQVNGSSRFAVAANGSFTSTGISSTGAVSILTSTSPQLTVGFDASNRYTTAVSSTGGVTFDASGAGAAFAFADATTLQGTLAVTGTSTFTGRITANGGITSPGSGSSSENFGNGSAAAGNSSVAVGRNATVGALAQEAVVIGTNATSSGTTEKTIAIGTASSVSTINSVAIGAYATVSGGNNAVAIGQGAVTSVANAVAIGRAASVGNIGGIALGVGATTTASNQLIVGSTADANASRINSAFFGNGVTAVSPANFTLNATGADAATSNLSGATLTLAAGRNTGTGTNNLVLQASAAVASGANAQTLTNRLTVQSNAGVLIANNPTGATLDVTGNIRLGAAGTNNLLHTTAAAGAASGDLYWGNSALVTAATISSYTITEVDTLQTVTARGGSSNQAISLTAAGTALAVTNNATIGGTLAVTGATTLTGLLTANGGITSPGSGTSAERFGASATAVGNNSIALGATATTTTGSYDSVALGFGASADGFNGIAIGRSSSAFTRGVAIGAYASTGANNGATVVGNQSTASAYDVILGTAITGAGNSVVIGGTAGTATSGGNASVSIGSGGTAAGASSVVLGYQANDAFGSSIALGRTATTTAANQFVVGSSSYGVTEAYFGRGVTAVSPPAFTLNATGGSGTNNAGAGLTLAGGRGTGTGLGGSITFQYAPAGSSGSTANALQTACVISGTNGSLSCPGTGSESERFGSSASTSTAVRAVAVGSSASASGDDSVAIGRASSAPQLSVVIGAGASATGRAVVIGASATSTGLYEGIAIGRGAVSSCSGGNSGVAIGGYQAQADCNSIAIGSSGATALQAASIALGTGATTTGANQLVIGGSSTAITSAFFGNGVTAASPQAITFNATGAVVGGTNNVAGAGITLATGVGTGTGAGGNLLFRVAYPGTVSANTANALTTVAIISGTNTASSGRQDLISLTPTVNQSGTAGYNGLFLNVTETAVGSGAKNVIDLQKKWHLVLLN